jgi:hypothetical protein
MRSHQSQVIDNFPDTEYALKRFGWQNIPRPARALWWLVRTVVGGMGSVIILVRCEWSVYSTAQGGLCQVILSMSR